MIFSKSDALFAAKMLILLVKLEIKSLNILDMLSKIVRKILNSDKNNNSLYNMCNGIRSSKHWDIFKRILENSFKLVRGKSMGKRV
jgi:hypothetical protein